jgi:capsule polysaccharide export protein KpsE/RkpR
MDASERKNEVKSHDFFELFELIAVIVILIVVVFVIINVIFYIPVPKIF